MLLRVLRRRARAGADAKLAHLEKAAVTDPLTGLRNRRTFDDDLGRALAKGRVCLVMLDLDGLKQTNERLGHAVGDERIRAVSAAVRAADRAATATASAATSSQRSWSAAARMPGTASPTACRTRCACSTAATARASPSAWPSARCAPRRASSCAAPIPRCSRPSA